MTPEDVEDALRFAYHETGIPFIAKLAKDSLFEPIRVRIFGLNEPSFFCLKASRGPISWVVEVEFDLFSNDIVATLVSAADKRRDEVNGWVREIKDIGYEASLFAGTDKTDSRNLKDELNFQLKITGPSLAFRGDDQLADRECLADLLALSSELLTDLMSDALRETPDGGDSLGGALEGTKIQALVTRVERSARNRRACFEFHGHVCHGCGLDPLVFYGEPARHLLHVHHVEPLATLNEPRVVDPKTDLLPLCPNCHSLAHKRTPPFSVLELQSFLKLRLNG